MAYAKIDYGFGIAELWGEFDINTVKREFYEKANQCFGIRKSISGFELLSFGEHEGLPSPWNSMEGAATVLKHSGGDTIVWNALGEKIKSEWD